MRVNTTFPRNKNAALPVRAQKGPLEYREFKRPWLILDSRILWDPYRHKRLQQCLASLSSVVKQGHGESSAKSPGPRGKVPVDVSPTAAY